MTTITATDIATVRRRSGDNTNSPYDLTDAEIDAIYVSTSLGNLDLWRTAYFVVTERLGIATNAQAVSSPLGSLSRNQKFEQLERLLAFLSQRTGIDQPETGDGGIAEWSANGSYF